MMDSKGHAGAARRIEVVYYLSRGGQLEHPHLLELDIPSSHSLSLKDVKKRLTTVRGNAMAATFSWSYKRSYKNGYVWQDLCDDNDLIFPANGCEYILKGSERLSPPVTPTATNTTATITANAETGVSCSNNAAGFLKSKILSVNSQLPLTSSPSGKGPPEEVERHATMESEACKRTDLVKERNVDRKYNSFPRASPFSSNASDSSHFTADCAHTPLNEYLNLRGVGSSLGQGQGQARTKSRSLRSVAGIGLHKKSLSTCSSASSMVSSVATSRRSNTSNNSSTISSSINKLPFVTCGSSGVDVREETVLVRKKRSKNQPRTAANAPLPPPRGHCNQIQDVISVGCVSLSEPTSSDDGQLPGRNHDAGVGGEKHSIVADGKNRELPSDRRKPGAAPPRGGSYYDSVALLLEEFYKRNCGGKLDSSGKQEARKVLSQKTTKVTTIQEVIQIAHGRN